ACNVLRVCEFVDRICLRGDRPTPMPNLPLRRTRPAAGEIDLLKPEASGHHCHVLYSAGPAGHGADGAERSGAARPDLLQPFELLSWDIPGIIWESSFRP